MIEADIHRLTPLEEGISNEKSPLVNVLIDALRSKFFKVYQNSITM